MVLLACLIFIFLFAERDLRQLSQDKRFAYITYQDLHTIREYKDKTVFAIKAPPGTQLEVPQELKKKVCVRSTVVGAVGREDKLQFKRKQISDTSMTISI